MGFGDGVDDLCGGAGDHVSELVLWWVGIISLVFFSKVFKEKRGHTVSPGNEERKAGGDSSFRWICKNLSSQYIL